MSPQAESERSSRRRPRRHLSPPNQGHTVDRLLGAREAAAKQRETVASIELSVGHTDSIVADLRASQLATLAALRSAFADAVLDDLATLIAEPIVFVESVEEQKAQPVAEIVVAHDTADMADDVAVEEETDGELPQDAEESIEKREEKADGVGKVQEVDDDSDDSTSVMPWGNFFVAFEAQQALGFKVALMRDMRHGTTHVIVREILDPRPGAGGQLRVHDELVAIGGRAIGKVQTRERFEEVVSTIKAATMLGPVVLMFHRSDRKYLDGKIY